MTTPSEPSLVQLWLHGGLDLSEQLQKEASQRPAERLRMVPLPFAPGGGRRPPPRPPAGYGPVQPGRPPLPAAV